MIPQVKAEDGDGEEITYEAADATMRRAVNFWSALQTPHGHWPAENAGVTFFVPPFVSTFRYFLIPKKLEVLFF